MNATMCVVLTTATGLIVGTGFGVLLGFVGLFVWFGTAIGGTAGALSGALAAVDELHRFAGAGQWSGLAVGLITAAGCVGYAAAYGPGMGLVSGYDLVFLLGGCALFGGNGWLSGRLAERVGRAIADL